MIASGQSRELAMQRPSEDRMLSSATDDGGEGASCGMAVSGQWRLR